jgi:vitamin-K-epoxide reductase (warfarin-sensitive)
MRFFLLTLTLLGIIASSLALREHYRPYGESPCSINEHWDCGVVNHSPYAMIAGVPVAVIGIIGYIGMAFLAARRLYRFVLAASVAGLAFSLYLAHIESSVLGVWCIYCVASLVIISLLALTSLGLSLIPSRPS